MEHEEIIVISEDEQNNEDPISEDKQSNEDHQPGTSSVDKVFLFQLDFQSFNSVFISSFLSDHKLPWSIYPQSQARLQIWNSSGFQLEFLKIWNLQSQQSFQPGELAVTREPRLGDRKPVFLF